MKSLLRFLKELLFTLPRDSLEWDSRFRGNCFLEIPVFAGIYSSNLMSSPRPFNSCINTLNDSGSPGSGIVSPFTIAS